MTRLKDVAVLIAGQSPKSEDVELLDNGLPFLQGNAEFGRPHPEPRYQCLNAEKISHSGDVLLSVRAPVGAVNISDRNYGIGRGLCAVRATSAESSFVYWWLLDRKAELDSLATGSTFLAVSSSVVGSLVFPDIRRDRQRSIADYLDRETERIDTLIREQLRLIEMLKERRSDLVATTVLGAFNPFDPPPGAPAVVHHYSVILGKMLDAGRRLNPGDEELPYIRAGNIQDDGLRLTDVNVMPFSPTEASVLDLRAGDLLVVEGGAVGTNVVLRDDIPRWSFQKTVNRVRPRANASGAWLGFVLRTYRDRGIIDVVCNKSTIPHLTAEKLRTLRIPDTPASEQRRIATFLDEKTAKIDSLIAETERFIELSQERRAALITAAVTGQIDVRAEVA